MKGWGQDRHQEAVVYVADQLVPDARMGHLETAQNSMKLCDSTLCGNANT